MEIVKAEIKDVPEIIQLLRISLGEKLLPKTEAFFIWKHFKNPFGISKILLAKENNHIVGIRAFMYWKWANCQEEVISVRAVDTSTHPSFQGKGIFKQLTLKAVEECKNEKVTLVFNTPNSKSIKGYIKMGWKSSGRLPICIRLGKTIPARYRQEVVDNHYQKYSIKHSIHQLGNDWRLFAQSSFYTTPIHYSYLSWRYADCPTVKYGGLIKKNEYGIVFRLKNISGFIELRICEYWCESDIFESDLNSVINELIKEVKPLIVTLSPDKKSGNKSIKKTCRILGPIKAGPVVTLKAISTNFILECSHFKNWKPSIGTMELF